MSTTALSPNVLQQQTTLQRLGEYALPMGAISVIFVMLVPLPAAALDFLLALSMAASVVVFLTAVQIRRAVELSVFPTLLLLLTLFRLALNIASSRRILLHGCRVGRRNRTSSRSQIPDVTLSRHPARAVHERPAPFAQA
jgi:flagellar biosynthesis protein FlhA